MPWSAQKGTRGAPRHLRVRKATTGEKGIFLKRPAVWGCSRSQCRGHKAETTQEPYKKDTSRKTTKQNGKRTKLDAKLLQMKTNAQQSKASHINNINLTKEDRLGVWILLNIPIPLSLPECNVCLADPWSKPFKRWLASWRQGCRTPLRVNWSCNS